jgi:uncharacterized protein YaeQ
VAENALLQRKSQRTQPPQMLTITRKVWWVEENGKLKSRFSYVNVWKVKEEDLVTMSKQTSSIIDLPKEVKRWAAEVD